MGQGYTLLHLVAAGHTDPGQRRSLNEDAWWIAQKPDSYQMWDYRGRLFVVADGMGGHAAGEVASRLGLVTLVDTYYGEEEGVISPSLRLRHAIEVANARIFEQAASQRAQAGMGTTIVAAVVRGERLLVGNVGDSRAYLIRDSQAEQITRDHSWVAEQVSAGNLTEQQAENHMYRNVVTRCLGHHLEVDIDLFERELQVGDAILLCSDGLTNQVSDVEIAAILTEEDPYQATRQLVELANERGGPDNITAVVFKAYDPAHAPAELVPAQAAQFTSLATTPREVMVDPIAAVEAAPATTVGQPRLLRPRRSWRRMAGLVLFAVVAAAVCTVAGLATQSQWEGVRNLVWPLGDSPLPASTTVPAVAPTGTALATATPSLLSTSTATPRSTPTSTRRPTRTSTPTPLSTPTQTLTVTVTSTVSVTLMPSAIATLSPTLEATQPVTPSATGTVAPTSTP